MEDEGISVSGMNSIKDDSTISLLGFLGEIRGLASVMGRVKMHMGESIIQNETPVGGAARLSLQYVSVFYVSYK